MKNKILFSSIIFLSLFALAKNSQAATLYVDDNNCSDSRTYAQVQSPTNPWCTIQKAADNVVAGDTVIVKDGTYTDTDSNDNIVRTTRGGTATSRITFKSENKWGAVLDCKGNTTGYGWVFSAGSEYIRVENFEIKGCASTGFHSNTSGTHDIYIYGNKIHDIGRVQTYITNGRSGVFQGNGTSYHTYDSNVFYTIGRLNPYTSPSAPESLCTTPYGYVYNSGAKCESTEGCVHCYNHDHGIYAFGHDNTIVNNIFYDIKSGWALQLAGGTSPGGPNWNIVNNTFYGANPQRDGHVLFWNSGVAATNILVQNNISHSSRNYFFHADTMNTSTWTIKNNLVYGAAVEDITGGIISGNITGQDPKFVNLTNKDFHLQSTSPAIGKGLTTNAPSLDFDGVPRGSSIDIGAYEYVGSDTTPPANPTGLRVQ